MMTPQRKRKRSVLAWMLFMDGKPHSVSLSYMGQPVLLDKRYEVIRVRIEEVR